MVKQPDYPPVLDIFHAAISLQAGANASRISITAGEAVKNALLTWQEVRKHIAEDEQWSERFSV